MEQRGPSIAASVAVFAELDEKFLIIRRLHEPFKNSYAFPGGFLDVDEKEDLEHTAKRELEEETEVVIDITQLQLVDVRSSPSRDPRGHVIDVGYLCVVKNICKIPKVTDEAEPMWISKDQMDCLTFAFDHNLYWDNIKTLIG